MLKPIAVERDTFLTVAGAFDEAALRWPEHAFLCVLAETAGLYEIPAGEISYREAATRVAQLRDAYARAGYGFGHRVGLLLENRPAFFLHWFALNALGVSVVPIGADLRSAELEYLVRHSEIALAIGQRGHHPRLRAAADAACRPLALTVDGEAPADAPFPAPEEHRSPDELTECALLYTSGTTGPPKGCILPNRYFLHAGRWYASVGGLAALRVGQERMLTPLPLVHMNAMAFSTMVMVLTGGCLIILDRFHPATWWASVRESRATVVHYLGVMPSMLMKAEAGAGDRQHAVRFGFGAGVDRMLHAAFEARFGFPLLEAWAMTETGAGAVVIAHVEPRRAGTSCLGREGPGVEVRLAAEDGTDACVDQPGELWVRHAGVDARYGFFTAYLKDPEATAEAWREGWFHTGDIVSRDAEGLLHFIDRRKNLIRRSGENVSAVEVEAVLNAHPEVATAAVAPIPDVLRGEEVIACIVTRVPVSPENRHDLAARIVGHVLARLAYYKAPGYVAFVDALPLTASQKIQRGALRALVQTLPGQAHCVDTRNLKGRQGR